MSSLLEKAKKSAEKGKKKPPEFPTAEEYNEIVGDELKGIKPKDLTKTTKTIGEVLKKGIPKTKRKESILKIGDTKPKKDIDIPYTSKESGKIIGLFGKQGTGKTKRAMDFFTKGKLFFLDSENKAKIIYDEKFTKGKYKADITISSFRVLDKNMRIDKYKTVENFLKNIPNWVNQLKKPDNKYRVVVIDNIAIFRPYSIKIWLHTYPKRTKPQPYEYGEVEEYVQYCLYPFINLCREGYIDYLIFCCGIKDKYLKDTIIGTEENSKQWLLGEIDYEFWLEWDYKVYCLKHPIRPFFEFSDFDINFSTIFDTEELIDEAEMKQYQQFKEEILTSDSKRAELKKERKQALTKLI